MPRGRRVKGYGESFYHIVSHVVDQELPFTAEENRLNVKLLRNVETFSAVQVIAFCFMSNHVHILLRVPRRETVSEEVLFDRIKVLYGTDYLDDLKERWGSFRAGGHEEVVREEQAAFVKRMYDMGEFMKTLKQRLTMSFNKRNKRKGTLWEERYKSLLLEPTFRVLSAVAAYIDLNPVRAGMVEEPRDYPFSSYGQACADDTKARDGLCRIQKKGDYIPTWDTFVSSYRTALEWKLMTGKKRRRRVTKKRICAMMENRGPLKLAEIVGARCRFFTLGPALGGEAFVEGVRERKKAEQPRREIPRKARE